jgi:hypothetical protein
MKPPTGKSMCLFGRPAPCKCMNVLRKSRGTFSRDFFRSYFFSGRQLLLLCNLYVYTYNNNSLMDVMGGFV